MSRIMPSISIVISVYSVEAEKKLTKFLKANAISKIMIFFLQLCINEHLTYTT